jgi:ribosomal protein S12 methylthiotransferase
MHSKPPEAVLAEARELVSDGAVEITLIGQDTTGYGVDIGYEPGLAGLLRRLNDEVDGAVWLRLMYAYPSGLTEEMIEAVAQCERVVKYVDLPLQHINDRVLKRMGRRIGRQATERLLQRVRDRIGGVSIRTTLMAGFPGETDGEFEELLALVGDFKFEALGVFAFSAEPDTPAGRMADQVPEEVKRERVEALMTTQQQVAFELADRRRGQEFEVLIDGPAADDLIPARHAGQAPEVDSLTWVQVEESSAARGVVEPMSPGRLVGVRCTGRRDYDLLAVPRSVALAAVV